MKARAISSVITVTANAKLMTASAAEQTLSDEIPRLEAQLSYARGQSQSTTTLSPSDHHGNGILPSHTLLLLSDSALPLGSFAFSSGLESYIAHHPPIRGSQIAPQAFPNFLNLSLASLATSILPYLIAAYRSPERLRDLDSTLDACTLCPVARRASIAQGKALLTLWDRALKAEAGSTPGAEALSNCTIALRNPPSSDAIEDEFSGHFPLVWAVVTASVGISLQESAYTFFFNHAKALVSAAVRASVMGPYAAQGVLASRDLRGKITGILDRAWKADPSTALEEAAQGVPMCDLWIGRHELLYSRIFNS